MARLLSPAVGLAQPRLGILAVSSLPSNTCRFPPFLPGNFFSSATRLTIHSSGRAFGTPLNSNVSLRCRNSMQGIPSFIAKHCTGASTGTTPSQSRAVRPAAAGEPPRRVGSWFPSTEPSVIAKVTLGPASSLSSAQAKSAGCSRQVGTAWVASSLRNCPPPRRFLSIGGSAGVTGGQPGLVADWYPCRWLTTEQYMPFQPVSSFPVLLVGDQANHSFERTCLRHATQFKR